MNLYAVAKYDEQNNRWWAVLRTGGKFFAIPDDQAENLQDGQSIHINIHHGYEYCNIVKAA